jgi:hypothetical protein
MNGLIEKIEIAYVLFFGGRGANETGMSSSAVVDESDLLRFSFRVCEVVEYVVRYEISSLEGGALRRLFESRGLLSSTSS